MLFGLVVACGESNSLKAHALSRDADVLGGLHMSFKDTKLVWVQPPQLAQQV